MKLHASGEDYLETIVEADVRMSSDPSIILPEEIIPCCISGQIMII